MRTRKEDEFGGYRTTGISTYDAGLISTVPQAVVLILKELLFG
jgi:hypothetical protein